MTLVIMSTFPVISCSAPTLKCYIIVYIRIFDKYKTENLGLYFPIFSAKLWYVGKTKPQINLTDTLTTLPRIF